jgi:hypothetical protein
MKHFIQSFALIILFVAFSANSLGQNEKQEGFENKVVKSAELSNIKKTELKAAKIDQNESYYINKDSDSKGIIQSISNKPEQLKQPTHQVVKINKENLPKSKSATPELNHSEKITLLENQIKSFESKIALLNDDPELNKEEITEKQKGLESLKKDLQMLLKN